MSGPTTCGHPDEPDVDGTGLCAHCYWVEVESDSLSPEELDELMGDLE